MAFFEPEDQFTLVFSTSFSWQSRIIRMMCHSQFSHVDLKVYDIEPYGLMGAADGGVAIRLHDEWPFKSYHETTIRHPNAAVFKQLVRSQLGKPFDDVALHQVISEIPRDWKKPDRWFCSELQAWALEEADIIKIIVPKNRVTPGDLLLLLNPFIEAKEFWASVNPSLNMVVVP